MIEKDKALRFSDGRYTCPACAKAAVYEITTARLAKVKQHLAWFPLVPVEYKIASRETLPKRQRRMPLSFGRCKPVCEMHGRQQLVVSHEVEILVGLPATLHEAILVHELFHAWLHENFPEGAIRHRAAEWMCEQMSLLYLRASRAKTPWRRVVKARRDQYRFSLAAEFKEKTQEQIIETLLGRVKNRWKKRKVCLR